MTLTNKFQVERMYDLEKVFNQLFAQGKDNKVFNSLHKLILSEDNILLALKNIGLKIGRHTRGVDGKTISDYEKLPTEKFIQIVKRRFNNFKPMKVRRIAIPKDNGTQRILGILTVEDRIIQQCIKQILEPICESKFHPNSFGFRPLRSTKYAINQMILLLQMAKYDYCVDIDLKNFFDNVAHEILIEQIYNLGIHDKKLLSVISKMLKVYVEGEGIKSVGLVQGANLSPLLSNIVLNEFDWWLNSQCKTKDLTPADNRIYFVNAFKIFNKIKIWLNETLKLNISQEKSKILNIKIHGVEFLGFKIKSTMKNGVYSVESHIAERNKLKIQNNLCKIISKIDSGGKNAEKVLKKLNQQIMLAQNYYESASHVQQDFVTIAEHCQSLIDDKLSHFAEKVSIVFLGKSITTYKINATVLIPLACVVHRKPRIFPPNMSIYARANVKKFNAANRGKTSRTKCSYRKIQSSPSEIGTPPAEEKPAECGLIATIKKYFSNLFCKKNTAPQI